jgi:glycosyltransferase involved in cell wall biosynthesis
MPFYRINFLITGLDYGGAEVQLVHLATRLKARGWDVRIISIMPHHDFIEELSSSGIPVVSLEVKGKNPLIIFRAYIRLLRILRSWNPHILHCHMFHANLLGRMTRLFYSTPVSLSTIQTIYEGGKLRDIAYRLSDPLTDLTTICSSVSAERFIRISAVPEHKLIVIPNGVDITEFRPSQEIRKHLRKELKLDERFAWLAAARLEVQKDYPCLLHAFARVAPGYPNAILLIAGQGLLRPALAGLVDKLGLSEKVRFLGLRKDLPGLMNAADSFVMSSAWEGMPIVLLDASATGLPIVATDVGGNREVVVYGESGLLAPPKNADALAGSMLQMMALPDAERRQMGEAGRRYIEEHYSLEHIVDTWEALYNNLLRKKGLV